MLRAVVLAPSSRRRLGRSDRWRARWSRRAGVDATPPVPAGCITDVSTGDHVYSCGGLAVDARIPARCQAPGCGLVLVLHGDTGTGLLMDAHVKMRELGEQHGFVVIAPTGPPYGGGLPGSTWKSTNDTTLVQMVRDFAAVFRVDPKNIHVTGFSRGAFMTWRLLCDYSDLFASAAPAGAGFGANFGETTCFTTGRAPARKLPIIFLMGRTDSSVGYPTMTQIRDAAIANYAATGPTNVTMDAMYRHDRWSGSGIIETFDHAYETVMDGPFASANGHCIPGSTTDPYAPQYAIPCQLPNAFVWGEEVMRFFRAHPMP
jgi:pimeloyl-ACP methyl ester carboxylesterase